MSSTISEPRIHQKAKLKTEISFALIHLLPLGAFFTGATLFDWIVCAFLYFSRGMFGLDWWLP